MAEIGNYALIENGVVVNVIVWDGDLEKWQPPAGQIGVKYTEADGAVSIGWHWNGEIFSSNEDNEGE